MSATCSRCSCGRLSQPRRRAGATRAARRTWRRLPVIPTMCGDRPAPAPQGMLTAAEPDTATTPVAPPTVQTQACAMAKTPADREDHGQGLLARVSNEMVRAQKQFFGKGPTEAKSYMLDDFLLIVMRGGLTTAEKTMLEFGKPDQVRQFRQLFENEMTERLTDMVERLTAARSSPTSLRSCSPLTLSWRCSSLTPPLTPTIAPRPPTGSGRTTRSARRPTKTHSTAPRPPGSNARHRALRGVTRAGRLYEAGGRCPVTGARRARGRR